jgi:peroxiredoxin
MTVNVGDEAPDFTLPSLDGTPVSLSDYRGVRLVLFMWASW